MPKISIEKTTALSGKEAFEKIQKFLSDDPDLRKMDSSYKCQFNESNLTGSAKGGKFDAQLKIKEGGTTTVVLTVELPFLLTPFKGVVETTLDKKLTRLLG